MNDQATAAAARILGLLQHLLRDRDFQSALTNLLRDELIVARQAALDETRRCNDD